VAKGVLARVARDGKEMELVLDYRCAGGCAAERGWLRGTSDVVDTLSAAVEPWQ
jgi:hypothetical protein